MRSSRVGRAVLVGGLAGLIFAACAQGANPDFGSGGFTAAGGSTSSSSGKPDAGPSGQIGSPCSSEADCKSGFCLLFGPGKFCTAACPPACPNGTYCSIVQGMPICIPDLGQQCDLCSSPSDCKMPSDNCLTSPLGDKFCARDCSVDGICPTGYECKDANYGLPDGGTPDGGSSSSSASSSSGTTTGSSSGTGGSGGAAGAGGGDGGTFPVAPVMWCVPAGGMSCPCNAKRDGITNACFVTNTFGSCAGTETCNGKAGTWTGCTAGTPAAEVCNGMDDNCNGQIDDGDPNQLCMDKGPQPVHSTWACMNGMCSRGACDAGWTNYPPGPDAQGCPCQVDANEPDDSCGAAKNLGTIKDVGATTSLKIDGTLSSDSDVDVYTFQTQDTAESGTNSYHVSILFTQPANNTEFVMDVLRGPTCVDNPSGAGTSVTSYDWCVNGAGGGSGGQVNGEGPCCVDAMTPTGGPCGAPSMTNHCADHSSQYFIRVHRAAGVTSTCTPYEITVSAGGGSCDLTMTCP